jgi:hypothetical protein
MATTRTGNIFPLPGVGPPPPPTSRSRRCVARYRYRCRVAATSNRVVTSLNQFGYSFWRPKPKQSSSPSPSTSSDYSSSISSSSLPSSSMSSSLPLTSSCSSSSSSSSSPRPLASSRFSSVPPSSIPSLSELDSEFQFRSSPDPSSASSSQTRLLQRIQSCSERFVGRHSDSSEKGDDNNSVDSIFPSSSSSSRGYVSGSGSPQLSSDHDSVMWSDVNPISNLENIFPQGLYGQSFTAPAVSIIADKVALPTSAGQVHIADVLPPHLHEYYVKEFRCIRPIVPNKDDARDGEVTGTGGTPARAQRLGKPRAFASEEEYRRLLVRMRDSNMITFTDRPMVVNGVFAIEKPDKSQRLILDARWANKIFDEPPHVDLPTQYSAASG